MNYRTFRSEWSDYYSGTNYTGPAAMHKAEIADSFLKKIRPSRIWDFGANDGRYTRLALKYDAELIAAFDSDPDAVEFNYQKGKKNRDNILPLILDLTNPSGGSGFAGRERAALPDRGKPDCIMMLAVIHHLAVSDNLPLGQIAEWLSGLTSCVIMEFVPKEDSQVQRLLACRKDIFPDYTRAGFENAFSAFFRIEERIPVRDSLRVMYLLCAESR